MFVCTGEAPDVTGKKAAEELFRNIEHGGCVDEYLQDQVSQSEQHPLLICRERDPGWLGVYISRSIV